MRAFVTGTGRCGTSTFYHALRHCINYTVGHESRSGLLSPHVYPDQHIEVSHLLPGVLPDLRARYPDAKWIHLVRGKDSCCRSLVNNLPAMLSAYLRLYYMCQCNGEEVPAMPEDWPARAAALYYHDVNALCRALLPDAMTVRLETAATQWGDVWAFLGLQGDFVASRAEWSRAYNHSDARGLDNYMERPRCEC